MRRPAIVAVICSICLVALSGGARAFWSARGSGSGSLTVGTMQPVTVAAFVGGDSPSSTLYPGGPAAEVILRINNQNSFGVTLVGVTGNGTITAVGGSGTCSITGVTLNPPAAPNVALLPGSQLVRLSGAATMSSSSDTGCQGATFHIPVKITVQK